MNQPTVSGEGPYVPMTRSETPIDAPLASPPYGRMFPELPPFGTEEHFLRALGRHGGLCECTDTDDTPESLGDTAAGWPIFGQLVAHDITADRSRLRSHVNPAALHNARSPQLNLECLYGDDPVGHPFLYLRDDSAKFLLGPDGADLQRNAEGIAIIGDPRNDSHTIISQLHLALLKAHNAFVDEPRLAGTPDDSVFDEANRELRWHYQWSVLNEFLPALVGQTVSDQVLLQKPRWFRPGPEAFIPVEFAHAAYRYGHAQIRHRYQLNPGSDPVPLFPDLLGFRAVPREHIVDWKLFFDTNGATTAQRCKRMDGKLVKALIQLPIAVSGSCELEDYQSLAVRDLQRGQGLGLPSGEEIARFIGSDPLTVEQVGLEPAGWRGETPLLYYILREADICTRGDRLGPVGGVIVSAVLVGLVDADPTSYLHDNDWRPRRTLAGLLGC